MMRQGLTAGPVMVLGALIIQGCASDFTNDPELKAIAELRPVVVGLPNPTLSDLSNVLASTFSVDPATYQVCEASPQTRRCDDPEKGMTGIGLGGIVLPLLLEVNGFTISEVVNQDQTVRLTSDFDTTVNAVPPLCARTEAQAKISEDGKISIDFDRFYCNWLAIGNVVTKVDLFVDWIDPATQSFAGAYAVQFNGTGNAFGTGYFLGRPVSE